ncbi:hypothetical protein BGZ99_008565 [Dissophora globulifera]|uniref:Uncharacterized protein n=1 Tax=Dissophora globulifera TaxID=979702 RepID=A0A9P6R9D6_9FUNG|nr:hypothetical protein BGZ99_008565 [Dissophora globulifera]
MPTNSGSVPKALRSGPLGMIKDIYTQNGVRGFYRGHMPIFLHETGGGAAWFGSYEAICHLLVQHEQSKAPKDVTIMQKDLQAPRCMLAGAIAGMAYNFILFPADCVKSHMQTEDVLRNH